jgi:hypothetical protein
MSLQGYYNRFSSADRYDELLFRASKGLQSAELNEIQSIFSDRLQKIANVLFRDGSVVRGASASINAQSGVVQMDGGAVYVLGAVREVASSTFTIPTTGDVQIGVRVVTQTITELESSALRDPAVGTRNYQEAGAGRTRRTATWAWNGDGGGGEFYSVYAVRDGVLLNQDPPPQLDGVKQLIARYDRDANGNYIVNGLSLFALGKNATQSNYVYSVQEGVANVEGNKIDKPQATPLSFPIDPDLQLISNEPKVSTGTGTQTITLNRKPLNNILDVVVTAEKTVTMTHGSFTGALDALPDTAVLSIQQVTQGATTYVAGTDYNLTADQVDWSPSGAEPAPGSTYSITYRYLTSVSPTNINADAGTFQIQGAVANTLVLVDYRWKMPRYDAIVLDRDGAFSRIKGVPSAFNPIQPGVSDTVLQIASVYHDWISTAVPKVSNDGTRVVSMKEQRQLKESIVELYGLVADERLQRDISSREPTAKYGVFTDPLFDDDLRDAGVSQDAVIVGQDLQLAISGTPVLATQNNTTEKLLPSVDEVLIGQELRTGEMKINPYQNFEPIPARVSLDPAIDLWTITDNQTSFATQSFVFGSGSQSSTSVSTVTQLVSESRSAIEFLRTRNVNFSVAGFGPNEALTELRFDGRNITPAGTVANLSGSFGGSFTVPANVPAGNKLVEFIGQQGSYGAAVYTGQGTLVIRNFRQTTTTTTRRWNPPPPPPPNNSDPLAQSFTLENSRHITGIDLKFAVKGGNKPVQVQIRESSNGFPTRTVLAETVIQPNEIVTTNTYVRANFRFPVFLESGVEYFIVLLTDDANHAVRVAELGKYDSTAARWVTAQPYTVGVLLSSSNAITWTAHQDKDLTFRLVGANFTANEQVFNLGSVTVSSMTDLLVVAPVELPSENTEVFFRYTRTTGEAFTLAPGQALQFAAAINDTMQVQAILRGTATESPVLFPGVQSVIGSLDTSGFYQSRQFQIGAGGSTMRVVFDALVPGSSTVMPQYDKNGFQNMTLLSATPIGDGYVEYVYQDTGIVGLTASKVKLNLTGTAAHRPKVRNIRAVMV